MDALTLLTSRFSSARLTEPAPAGEALDNIKRAALQVPDHGNLRPWRFVIAQGRQALCRLGDIFAEAAIEEDPTISLELQERARQLPLRGASVQRAATGNRHAMHLLHLYEARVAGGLLCARGGRTEPHTGEPLRL